MAWGMDKTTWGPVAVVGLFLGRLSWIRLGAWLFRGSVDEETGKNKKPGGIGLI